MKVKMISLSLFLIFVGFGTAFAQGRIPGLSSPSAKNKESISLAGSTRTAKGDLEKVIVYYFHGTARCLTCRKMEQYAREVVVGSFSEELKTGIVEWKAVNVDEPHNKHFVKDYSLYTKSLVTVAVRDGRIAEWKNLERIWELVRDENAFKSYIRDETRRYLNAKK